jgi:hypothetical protein
MNGEQENDHVGDTPEDIDRNETAIHEAAHAVAAVYFGFPLTGPVSIQGDGRNAGSSKIGKPKGFHGDGPRSYFLGEQEIVVNFAGTEAVRLFREDYRIENEGGFGDGDDIYQAKYWFQELESIFSLTENEEQFFDRLRSLTADLVAFMPVHDAVTALAKALLERETLSAEETEALIKKKLSMS